MSLTSRDCEALKLTVHDNRVWYLHEVGMPRFSGLSVSDFVKLSILEQSGRIRVPGFAHNAALLLELYQMKTRQLISELEVCSPLCCELPADRKDPEVMLYKLRSWSLPASLGGWHRFEQADAITYQLAEAFRQRTAEKWSEANLLGLRLVQDHPVWPYLQFLDSISAHTCAELLGVILDPRWYVDVDNPHRGAKLEQFLGLTPKIQAGLKREELTARHLRCKLVGEVWQLPVPGIDPDNLPPRHFLWRRFFALGGADSTNRAKATLETSKLLVNYLRFAWMNEVAAEPHRGRLFVPEYFFSQPDEVEAFRDHMAANPASRGESDGEG